MTRLEVLASSVNYIWTTNNSSCFVAETKERADTTFAVIIYWSRFQIGLDFCLERGFVIEYFIWSFSIRRLNLFGVAHLNLCPISLVFRSTQEKLGEGVNWDRKRCRHTEELWIQWTPLIMIADSYKSGNVINLSRSQNIFISLV